MLVLAKWLFMFFPPIVTISRWPSHFLILFIALGFAWAFKQKSKDLFYAYASVVSGLASFIRPEIQISFYIFFSIFLLQFIRQYSSLNRKESLARIALAIPSTIFIYLWARQLFSTAIFNKSLFVFQDFTALRYRQILQHDINPQLLFNSIYQNSSSPLRAVLSNPLEFFYHLEFSIKVFVVTFFQFVSSYQILIDSKLGQMVVLGLVSILCLYLFSKFLQKNKKISEDFTYPPKVGFSTILIVIVPNFLSCLFFGTVPRYLLPILAAMIIIIAARIRREWRLPSIVLSAYFTALVYLVPIDFTQFPYLLKYFGFDNTSRMGTSDELADTLFLREIKLVEQKKIITSHFPGFLYVQDGVGLDLCWNDFSECPQNRNSYLMSVDEFRSNIFDFNVFLLTKAAKSSIEKQMHPGPLRDSFLRFLQMPNAFGFRTYSIPCSTDIIYIKDSAKGSNGIPDGFYANGQKIQSCKSLAFSN